MQRTVFCALVCTSCLVVILAKPKDEKSRVHDGKLSREEHFSATGEHNPEYDHDAFLGSEKKEFDHLTPEESKKRLEKLINRIDKDKDGKLTKDELKEWIRFASKRWMYDDADRLWKHFKKLETHWLRHKGDNPDKKAVADPNSPIGWELWKQDSFGNEVSENEEPTFRRDRKRWDYADTNKDDKISKEEFAAFIHPHQFDHMKDIVVAENLREIDTNMDGYVSPSEYMADVLRAREFKNDEEKEDFVKTERESFHHTFDQDKDGRLNMLTKIGRR